MYGKPFTLGAAHESAVKREVCAHTGDLFLAITQGSLQVDQRGLGDLLGAFEHRDAFLQRLGIEAVDRTRLQGPVVLRREPETGANDGQGQ